MGNLLRTLLLLHLTIGCLPGVAQVIDTRICDSSVHIPITSYTAYLRTTSPVTIDSVLRSPLNFIKAADNPVMVFNYDPYYYWFRIIVKNAGNNDQPLMLLMAPFGLYEGRLFQQKAGVWTTVAHTGLKYRFTDRSYQFTHHVFPFVAAPNSIDTLYISVDATNAYKSFGFALLKPKALKLFENKIYFVFGIIVGLLILFFIVNFSLFFALKEKLHLWYALYIFLLFGVVMKNDHLDQQFLGLDSEAAFRATPYMTIGALAIAVLMHVVQRFLKPVISRRKLLYRISAILKINVVCSAVVHAFVFAMAHNYRIHAAVFIWAKTSTLLAICMIIVSCIYSIRKGFKSAWFILLGTIVFMIGSLQRLFYAGTSSFLFPPTTFHIGIIVETFVISMALIYRFWSEREQQRERETQIRIHTLHDISGEIHDNVGQTLALANLYLRTVDVKDEAALLSKVEEARKLVSKTIVDLRGLSRIMKNDPECSTAIGDNIKTVFLGVQKTGELKVAFTTEGEVPELENTRQAIIIRIMQEITQNIIKHSGASQIKVCLVFKRKIISIKIHDNGIGFNLPAVKHTSNGLKNIKNRCLLLNAGCHIETGTGQGTEIAIHIPV